MKPRYGIIQLYTAGVCFLPVFGREKTYRGVDGLIKFEDVSKTYDKKPGENSKFVLNNLNLTIDDGEFVFVMGESGAGKTTLTKLLLREERVTSGKLFVDNYRLDKIPARKVPYLRRNMGVVFQDFRLFENKTVFENVAFAMEILGEPNSVIKKKVPITLEIVGLKGKENVMPAKLSGGEKQRLCVARAIVNNPSVIIADEPTGNLNTSLAKEIMDLLVKISRFGKTVIVVTHAEELVKLYNERIIKIENGILSYDSKHPEQNEKANAVLPDSEHSIDEDITNSEFAKPGANDSESAHMTYTDFSTENTDTENDKDNTEVNE